MEILAEQLKTLVNTIKHPWEFGIWNPWNCEFRIHGNMEYMEIWNY